MQADFWEFNDKWVYIVSSRIVSTTGKNSTKWKTKAKAKTKKEESEIWSNFRWMSAKMALNSCMKIRQIVSLWNADFMNFKCVYNNFNILCTSNYSKDLSKENKWISVLSLPSSIIVTISKCILIYKLTYIFHIKSLCLYLFHSGSKRHIIW